MSWKKLLKSKTVIGGFLATLGALLGKESAITIPDIVTAVGAIVGIAGARGAVGEIAEAKKGSDVK